MSEVKVYALTVPSDEIYLHWVGCQRMEDILNKIDVIAINPDGRAHHLLFATPEARKEAYDMIHAALPQSLCAYQLLPAYVDEKYLKPAERGS